MRARFLLAPDSFKGSLTAGEVASALARGIAATRPDAVIDSCPLADGGEGFLDAIHAAWGGPAFPVDALSGPLGASDGAAPPRASVVFDASGRTAAVELAAVAGLPLVPVGRRDPARTTTRDVGVCVRAALDRGATQVILGIGGSATNDGGCGAAQALGVRFMDGAGLLMDEPITGGDLHRIARIDLSQRDRRLSVTRLRIACDVTNPLTGSDGAARVYGPQKGATPAQVAALDDGLAHVAAVWRRDCGVDVETMPGAGAAGGFGGGAVAMLGATLGPGLPRVMDAVGFRRRLAGSGVCVTGEGQLDGQSLRGKVVGGVLDACLAAGVPCIAVVGRLGDGWEAARDAGLAEVVELGRGLGDEAAFAQTRQRLRAEGARLAVAWGTIPERRR